MIKNYQTKSSIRRTGWVFSWNRRFCRTCSWTNAQLPWHSRLRGWWAKPKRLKIWIS